MTQHTDSMQTNRTATLMLDDGTVFRGYSFGYERPVAGEVVFNTAMTGYPESLTDPSYAGQLMVLTYPLVGNYGVPPRTFEPNGIATFMESEKIHAEAIIVSDYSHEYSHWNAECSLGDWLKEEKIPGIYGIDTRALTKKLREHGVMMGRIVIGDADNEIGNGELKIEDYEHVNYVDRVSCKEIICYLPDGTSQTCSLSEASDSRFSILDSQFLKRVVLLDCGVKHNIIRCLLSVRASIVCLGTTTSISWNTMACLSVTVRAIRILAMPPCGISVRRFPGISRFAVFAWVTSCWRKPAVLLSIN